MLQVLKKYDSVILLQTLVSIGSQTFQANLQMHINGKSHLKCIHEVSWIEAIEIHWIEAFPGWNDGAGMQEAINLGRRY